MSVWSRKFGALLFVIISFFVLSALLYGLWNVVLPALITSIDGTVKGDSFMWISYPIAMAFMLLIFVILSPGAIMRGAWQIGSDTSSYIQNKSPRNAAAYNLSPAVSANTSTMGASRLGPSPVGASPLASTWRK